MKDHPYSFTKDCLVILYHCTCTEDCPCNFDKDHQDILFHCSCTKNHLCSFDKDYLVIQHHCSSMKDHLCSFDQDYLVILYHCSCMKDHLCSFNKDYLVIHCTMDHPCAHSCSFDRVPIHSVQLLYLGSPPVLLYHRDKSSMQFLPRSIQLLTYSVSLAHNVVAVQHQEYIWLFSSSLFQNNIRLYLCPNTPCKL